jgi:hypothetical protein
LLLFASIGDWKVSLDLVIFLNLKVQPTDTISMYIGLIIGTLIGFFIFKKRAPEKLKNITETK